ncbi:HAD-IB family phosphatase [Caviibacter abscessus]|uniref:HAD-IB family phosphatase n=1 Tax=Caviibacter abscessus TaxID=1766719 RepID=UPI000831827F|nr:HAD-IB family phosphatase [Caviibacter abscessus]
MIYLVDFDITVTKQDTLETIMREYNPEAISIIKQKYRNGEISMYDYIESALLSLNITKEQYIKCLVDNVDIDETFIDFFNSHNVKIVSFGTKLNIVSVLKKYGINISKEDVYANDIEIKDKKVNIINKLENKKDIVKEMQKYDEVTFIGDGPSDYDAMKVADFVFARSETRAVKYLRENKIDFKEFNNFNEIGKD